MMWSDAMRSRWRKEGGGKKDGLEMAIENKEELTLLPDAVVCGGGLGRRE